MNGLSNRSVISGPCSVSYFFIKLSTALVVAIMPVRIVGSGTGANLHRASGR